MYTKDRNEKDVNGAQWLHVNAAEKDPKASTENLYMEFNLWI